MRGNWDRGTNSSLTSKRSNKLILAFVMVVTLLAAMAAPAYAAGTYYPEEVEEWGKVEMTPYVSFNGTSGGALFLLQYGDQKIRDVFTYDGPGGALVLGSKQVLEKDHTYHLRFAITGSSDGDNTKYNTFYGVSITEKRPELVSEIAPSNSNSIGKNYHDLVKFSSISNGSFLIADFWFSTADGYIDNSLLGEVYINFLLQNLEEDIYNMEITNFDAYCMYDPDAYYYTNIWGDNLDQTADEFLNNTNLLAEKEREISGMANDIRSNVIDKFGDMINTTVNFVSPAATFSGEGNTSIYGAATSFIGLYNSIISSLPPIVQALFTVVPMLAFLAWLFGFGRSL